MTRCSCGSPAVGCCAYAVGAFYGLALFGGAALYLAGQLVVKHRMRTRLSWPRLVTTLVLLAAAQGAAAVAPLAALAGLLVILAALIGIDTVRHTPHRRRLGDSRNG